MTISVIKDFKIKESYFKLIENTLMSYLWEGVYKPMFDIMEIKPEKAVNSYTSIMSALNTGNIYYSDGVFYARKRFSNAQSTELKSWGGVYDKYKRGWRLPEGKIPAEIRVALASSKLETQQKLQALDIYLREVQANMHDYIDNMVFDNEVVTILDDAGNEVKKNAKSIHAITPELTLSQKRMIAETYTKNIQHFCIKDFADDLIPEMRKKVQQLTFEGARWDKVQEMLERDYGVAAKKAKFLARNETCIMLAEYKKATYTEMGFDSFIWHTIIDGRERELHKKLNGTVWRYDNPPIIDERTGERGLPGETYNCRCEQTPIRSRGAYKPKVSYEESEKRINDYLEKYAKEQEARRLAA